MATLSSTLASQITYAEHQFVNKSGHICQVILYCTRLLWEALSTEVEKLHGPLIFDPHNPPERTFYGAHVIHHQPSRGRGAGDC